MYSQNFLFLFVLLDFIISTSAKILVNFYDKKSAVLNKQRPQDFSFFRKTGATTPPTNHNGSARDNNPETPIPINPTIFQIFCKAIFVSCSHSAINFKSSSNTPFNCILTSSENSLQHLLISSA